MTWRRSTPRSSEIAVRLLKEDGSGDPYTRPGRLAAGGTAGLIPGITIGLAVATILHRILSDR